MDLKFCSRSRNGVCLSLTNTNYVCFVSRVFVSVFFSVSFLLLLLFVVQFFLPPIILNRMVLCVFYLSLFSPSISGNSKVVNRNKSN